MKRKVLVGLTIIGVGCLLTVILTMGHLKTYAANQNNRYVSKDIPSDELIMRQYAMLYQGEYQITEIVGKQKISENVYEVFYAFANGGSMVQPLELIKLYTNVWLMESKGRMAIIGR